MGAHNGIRACSHCEQPFDPQAPPQAMRLIFETLPIIRSSSLEVKTKEDPLEHNNKPRGTERLSVLRIGGNLLRMNRSMGAEDSLVSYQETNGGVSLLRVLTLFMNGAGNYHIFIPT